MRTHLTIIPATLIGVAALAVTGCGSNSPPSANAQASQSPAQAAFAFTRCMHAHGANIPDPHVSVNNGSTQISQVMPASAAAAPAFKSAQKACAYLQPGPQGNRPDGQGPSKPVLLTFARCLRGRGLTNFPDPNPQGQVTPQMLSQAGVDVRSSTFFNAARACIGVTHGQISLAQIAAAARGSH